MFWLLSIVNGRYLSLHAFKNTKQTQFSVLIEMAKEQFLEIIKNYYGKFFI